jgi:DNA-binding MarR family transcriptional regulator
MTMVKPLYDQTLNLDDLEPKHVGMLLERVTQRMRHDMGVIDKDLGLRARYAPLRPAHFRILSMVPSGGATLTELAVPARMTKQALGQFVEVMVEHGYLVAGRSPRDRRARIVTRTERGDAVVDDVHAIYDRLHAHWRRALGPQRWEAFREALVALAVGWDDTPPARG